MTALEDALDDGAVCDAHTVTRLSVVFEITLEGASCLEDRQGSAEGRPEQAQRHTEGPNRSIALDPGFRLSLNASHSTLFSSNSSLEKKLCCYASSAHLALEWTASISAIREVAPSISITPVFRVRT